jgi:hypothetical protein
MKEISCGDLSYSHLEEHDLGNRAGMHIDLAARTVVFDWRKLIASFLAQVVKVYGI